MTKFDLLLYDNSTTGGFYYGKYNYIRKTITWENRRYEVRGKTEQEACEKLAELVNSLKRGEFATSGNTTVDQWFLQWKETYKSPSRHHPEKFGRL